MHAHLFASGHGKGVLQLHACQAGVGGRQPPHLRVHDLVLAERVEQAHAAQEPVVTQGGSNTPGPCVSMHSGQIWHGQARGVDSQEGEGLQEGWC